jgi:hypothetical protein
MAFLHGDPGKLIGEKLDLDPDLRKKLDVFREKTQQRMVKYWNEPGDLKGQVALAMIQIRKSHPAEGWIRAGEAMTPEVKTELAELRARVRELTADLKDEQLQRATAIDTTELVQGDETAHITCDLEFHWQSTIDDRTAYQHNRERGKWTITPTWNRVFMHLGPELMDEASEDYLMERLSDLCLEMSRADLVKKATKDTDDEGNEEQQADDAESDSADVDEVVGGVYEATVTIDSFNDVKVQLVALALIESGTKRRPASDTRTYWRLTEQGSEQLLHLRAIRKPTVGTPDSTGSQD